MMKGTTTIKPLVSYARWAGAVLCPTINIEEIVEVLNKVLDLKRETSAKELNEIALLNVFKIRTSAGGARPKILISEHKETGKIIPDDMENGDDYRHYLVKLCMKRDDAFPHKENLLPGANHPLHRIKKRLVKSIILCI